MSKPGRETLEAYQSRLLSVVNTESIHLKELILLCARWCYDNPPRFIQDEFNKDAEEAAIRQFLSQSGDWSPK